jgi:ribA/ribD-fused uncharacterized protein
MKITDRIYNPAECVVFHRTTEAFGGLSNMATGYSLFVNQENIANTEILYQICRYPLFPAIQAEIIAQQNPKQAKLVSRQYAAYTRQDWDLVKFEVMSWCLRVKLLQNRTRFGGLLRETGDLPIVELAPKDTVWGAAITSSGQLVGKNALGRLLMHLRESVVKPNIPLNSVEPLELPGFLLYGEPIDKVFAPDYYLDNSLSQAQAA